MQDRCTRNNDSQGSLCPKFGHRTNCVVMGFKLKVDFINFGLPWVQALQKYICKNLKVGTPVPTLNAR